MTVITGRHIRIDHCTFTDGRFPDREAPLGFHGERVQRHDGLLDIEDGSDFITVSDSRFENHDKAILIGSGDGRGDRDRGHLKVTFARNLFSDIVQRAPRVRFGQVHVVNNVHRGRAPLYALGVGVESAIFSERNVFRYPGAGPSLAVAAYGGAASPTPAPGSTAGPPDSTPWRALWASGTTSAGTRPTSTTTVR